MDEDELLFQHEYAYLITLDILSTFYCLSLLYLTLRTSKTVNKLSIYFEIYNGYR